MEQECEECKAGAPDWMVTFADLMSLLLTFFVLLLSFSNTEIVKFKAMIGSVKNALGLKSEIALSDVPTGSKLLPHENAKQGDGGSAAKDIAQQLNEILQEAGLEGGGSAKLNKHGVVLQLEGDLIFGSGDARINLEALPVLDALAKYISTVSRSVDVIGHTDDVPISTPTFPSNWELSAARAGQAVRYMAEKGVPAERMRAIGQAHSVPVADNGTADGRSANRRIEFVFTVEEGDVGKMQLNELGSGEENGGDSNGDAAGE